MANHTTTARITTSPQAVRFGALVREYRNALGMTQDELAFATGVGRRFVIDLEAGKATVQLGRALTVAEAVGLRILDLMTQDDDGRAMLPDLLDGMPDDELPGGEGDPST